MRRDLYFLREFRTEQQFDYCIEDFSTTDDSVVDLSLNDIRDTPGVYIIVSPKTKFIYPNGKSSVIYIGKSEHLKSRLKRHYVRYREAASEKNVRESTDWLWNRYNYMKHHGARVYVYYTRGTQDAKNLESKIMADFYNQYESTPVGNGARSFQCNSNK